MKKIMFALLTVVMLGGIVACGEEKPETTKKVAIKKAPKIDVYVLRQEPNPAPEWVYEGDWEVAKNAEGKKIIYFKVQSQRPTLQKAMKDVKAEKSSLLAGIIKQLTSSEMVRAEEGMLNDEGEMDAYYSEIVASISRNVNTSGNTPSGTYWEYVQEVEGEASVKYYRVVKRFQMDYNLFQQRLYDAVVKQSPKINAKLDTKGTDFADKMNSQLDQLGE